MKKIIIFGSIVVALFILLAVVTNMNNKQQAVGNPYGKDTLHPETIKQLDDPIYQNQIVPNQLDEVLHNGGSAFVYFYSPTCSHCKTTSPVVVPLAKEMGINLQLLNLLEFEFGWDQYQIEGTPTIVHFENGAEVSRIEGGFEADVFEQWFNENK
ncbi:thioredoxin family protein [Calidifontibacillus oryziterrae]|uniref:thioredoxin family protein n=1 Tax=Calidifontibacillus oryziterrae TaxID=1191699 RepID=UPI00030527D0|nr:thioredoxin family protein [Calidifontibacillus oryziterrae]